MLIRRSILLNSIASLAFAFGAGLPQSSLAQAPLHEQPGKAKSQKNISPSSDDHDLEKAIRNAQGNHKALAQALVEMEMRDGLQILTLSLTQQLLQSHELIAPLLDAANDKTSPNIVLAVSVAISQAIVTIAESDQAAAVKMKSIVDRQASAIIRQQIAANLVSSTLSTATTK